MLFVTAFRSRFIVWSFESFKLLYAQETREEIVAVRFLPALFALAALTEKSLQVYSIENNFLLYELVCEIKGEMLAEQFFTCFQPIRIKGMFGDTYEQLMKLNKGVISDLSKDEASFHSASKDIASRE